MKKRRLVVWLSLALTAPAFCQQPTLARLSRESRADIPRVGDVARTNRIANSPTRLRDSTTSRAAAEAYFVKSNLQLARLLSERALRHDLKDAEALFVRMEVAAIEADDAAMLDSALRLCEAGASAPGDIRVRMASERIRESAANTPDFRRAIPRLQSLLLNSPDSWPNLHAALLDAAMDGASGLNADAVAREAGILTDWRIVGPLGLHPLLDLDQQLISPADDLSLNSYRNRAVENFQFPDGWIRLPDYLSQTGAGNASALGTRRGIFYAAGHFAALTTAMWKVDVESAGRVEIFVDGRRILRADASSRRYTANFEALAGPHRVLMKFAGAAAPLRVAVSKYSDLERGPLRANLSLQEATYLLAAEHYADAEPAAAIRQIEAVNASDGSAALEFLLAQSLARYAPGSQNSEHAWFRLHADFPAALAADVALSEHALNAGDFSSAAKYASNVLARHNSNARGLEVMTRAAAHNINMSPDQAQSWVRRLAVDPSCATFEEAVGFYAAHALPAERNAAEQKLEGCAPASLAYAQSLSQDGNHTEAVRALNRLLAAEPLHRAARLMLIQELQVAGEDERAQRAAVDWLRIAPNAENYHRLAAASSEITGEDTAGSGAEFYAPYRRNVALLSPPGTSKSSGAPSVVLLDDHVALARADGSVSLYIHTARRLAAGERAQQSDLATIPSGAQVLRLRVVHPDGNVTAIPPNSLFSVGELSPGDVIDSEYVLNFAGDGGISEHAEAFQFVFGSFDQKVLHSRFVVLTPADHADRGVVIATGETPTMMANIRDGMLERVWQKDASATDPSAASDAGLAIVRLVEQGNGWAVPSKAEHQRRIETIHPGPRSENS